MKIWALPKLVSEAEAYQIAEKRGNFLGRLLIRKDIITMKLIYIESREIIFTMFYQDAPVPRLFRRAVALPPTQKIRMLVEGTRGTPAYLGEELQLQEIEVGDASSVQNTEIPDETLIEEGKYLAKRMVRRQLGKTVVLEMDGMRSIYRPYYIAFYGQMEEGIKVRYLPIAADKNEIVRTN